MNELKAETIINAGIRIAEKNLTSGSKEEMSKQVPYLLKLIL